MTIIDLIKDAFPFLWYRRPSMEIIITYRINAIDAQSVCEFFNRPDVIHAIREAVASGINERNNSLRRAIKETT